MMLPQLAMIERLRRLCQQDERLVAAMLYGSFTRGEADAYSDIDCALFFRDEALPEIDQRHWVSQIAPVDLYYTNEFGNGVAIFSNLVRGEFHFDPASEMQQIEKWRGNAWFPSLDAALLVDQTGQLAQHLQVLLAPPPDRNTPEEIEYLCNSFLNWVLFGSNVMTRGEFARALEILQLVQDYLLRMARLLEGKTEHWITPTKALEQEISAEAYARFQHCTTKVEPNALWDAYLAAWQWGKEMLAELFAQYALTPPTTLLAKLDRRLSEHSQVQHP